MESNTITPPTTNYRYGLLTTLFCCLAISACDSNSGGGVRGITPGDTPDTSAYLFYLSEQTLMAVDPADPTNPIAVEPAGAGVTGVVTIPYLLVDNVTGQTIVWRNHTAVYAKDGRLWKVNALKSGNLTPIQLSNETGASTICQAIGSYSIDPNRAQYNYQLPGDDQICDNSQSSGDDVRKVVDVGMTENDSPKLFPMRISRPPRPEGAIEVFYDGNTLVGQLVLKGSDLTWCDAVCSPTSAKVLKTGVTKAVRMVWNSQGEIFLNIDGNVQLFESGTKTLGTVLHTGPSDSYYYLLSDGSNDSDMYLFGNKGIYRLPRDGSAVSTQLVVEMDTDTVIYPVRFTSDRIVYRLDDSLGVAVKSISKTGGTAIELYRDVALRALRVFVVDDLVYYSSINMIPGTSGIEPIAGVINTDGTGRAELGDALWSGYAWRTPFRSLWSADTQMRPRLFLVSDLGADGWYLSTYDTATGSKVADLGKLPQSAGVSSRLDVTTSDNNALIAIDAGNGTDIFFLNTETGGSLKRLTDNDVEESLVKSSWSNPS